ncbi:c-type cytochrome [Polynucleobacter sp. HIN7]|nr:c-type cytochrome [Polynucleobacter sp. HIN7]
MMKSALILSLLSASIGFAHAGNVAKGKELVEKNNCAACHGAGLKAPVAPAYPKIAGQYQDYLYYALKSYQVDGNSLVGRNNAIMQSQVKQFSDKDLKDMAAYIASIPGDLIVKK